MDDAVSVGGAQCIGHFACDAKRIGYWELPLALQSPTERLPLHVWHDVVQQPVRFTRIEQLEDVRVLKLRRRLDLAEETFATERGCELGMQDLDGNVPIVFDIAREIHCRHAAASELPLDAVLVR